MALQTVTYLRSEYNPSKWSHLALWDSTILNNSLEICLNILDSNIAKASKCAMGGELTRAVARMFDGGRSKYTHFNTAEEFIKYLRSRVSTDTLWMVYKLYAVNDRIQGLRREINKRQTFEFVDLEKDGGLIVGVGVVDRKKYRRPPQPARRHFVIDDDSDDSDSDSD